MSGPAASSDVNCELTLRPPPHPSPHPRRRSQPLHVPRARSNRMQAPGRNKNVKIPPPFPWAADRRAVVRSLEYLQAAGLDEIPGDSQCRHCEARITIKLDLFARFREVVLFMYQRQHLMHDRAPKEWLDPTFPGCESCGQVNCLRPVMPEKKRNINWLFLFLGQWVGCCTLEQLKYFCKHTKLHRTGAKDRLLYLSYFCISRQLDPMLPFVL